MDYQTALGQFQNSAGLLVNAMGLNLNKHNSKRAWDWMRDQLNPGSQTEQYNIRQEQRARDYALQDWLRATAYESPANQRRLLEEAGLNTALMYGTAGAGGQAPNIYETGTNNMPPQISNPAFLKQDYAAMAQSFQNSAMYNLQNSKLLNDIQKTANAYELGQARLNLGEQSLDVARQNAQTNVRRADLTERNLDGLENLRDLQGYKMLTDMTTQICHQRLLQQKYEFLQKANPLELERMSSELGIIAAKAILLNYGTETASYQAFLSHEAESFERSLPNWVRSVKRGTQFFGDVLNNIIGPIINGKQMFR